MAKHQFAVYGNFEDLHQNVSAEWSVTIQLNWISLAALFELSAGRSAAAQLRLSQWTQSGGKAVDYSQCSVPGE